MKIKNSHDWKVSYYIGYYQSLQILELHGIERDSQ
jgi:hypothetical protein